MKRIIVLTLTISLLFTVFGLASASSQYDVTEPITIEWWHSHEDQYASYIQHVLEQFHAQNPLITVVRVFMGSYSELNTHLIASLAAGDVPAIANTQSPYVAGYGAAGVAEILDPYIKAYNFDIADFGEGLVATTSHEGKQVALPYLI